MEVFFGSISGVLIILVMIAVGYVLTRVGWFNERSSKSIARIVTQVALPCYMVDTIMQDFTRQQLKTLLPDLRFPVVSMLILFAFSFAAVRAFSIAPSRSGLFKSMFLNSNTVFIGLPVNQALFGHASLPYVLVYYMANTTFFWTLGVYLIKKDGQNDETGFNFMSIIKKVFSPPLIGFIIGVILVMLGWHLPTFIMSDLHYIGGLTIPLSMFFIGIQIGSVGLHSITFSKDAIGILVGRFILAPIVMSCLVLPTHLPTMLKQVFIIQSAMPVMTNAPVVAKLYGADADYAAIMVTETTVISMLVIPILMLLIQRV